MNPTTVPPIVIADAIYAPLLRFIIYGILAPLVFLSVVLIGFELAWPRTLPTRRLLALFGASRVGDPPAFTSEPGFRTRCAVAGLAAVAMWSLAVTLWLSGYFRGVTGPSLSVTQASPRHTLIFLFTVILGAVLGFDWVARMRQADDAASSLAVIAVSMSLAGIALFFYIVEPGLRDWFLALALGIFLGELAEAARSPDLLREGLFAALFIVPPAPVEPLETEFPPLESVEADGWRGESRGQDNWEGGKQDVWQPPGRISHGPSALIGASPSSVPPADDQTANRSKEGGASNENAAAQGPPRQST